MKTADLLDTYSLRERKRARLRVGLLRAVRERVEQTPFAEITTRELATAMEVSEPTFFAHFASKTDLLPYHIAIWRIGTIVAASAAEDGAGFLRRFFDETAKSIQAGPRMWFEITAEVARSGGIRSTMDITAAERLIAHDDVRALDVELTSQSDLIRRHVEVALERAELDTQAPDAVVGLLAAFYGVPLALGPDRLDRLADAYRSQLDRFISG